MKELANQNIDFNKFSNMNVIAQEKVASALGLSADELSDQLLKQQYLGKSQEEVAALAGDEVADRISGVLIYNGIESNSMNSKEIDMVNSHIHVMTRLQGRNNITDNDISIQKMIFNQIIEKTNKTKK